MDKETGELTTEPETGEIFFHTCGSRDCETGEKAYPNSTYPKKQTRKSFKIPNEVKNANTKLPANYRPVLHQNCEQNSDWQMAVIFLLLTSCFWPVACLFLAIIELVLHEYSHRQNSLLKNDRVYFQSPLHCIVKEYCGRCLWENSAAKISKMQRQRNSKHLDYLITNSRQILL